MSLGFDSDENFVLSLPRGPLDLLLKKLTPGEIVDLSMIDAETKGTIRALVRMKPQIQQSYRLIFFKDYTEIKMYGQTPAMNFTWKFINQKDMSEERGTVHQTPKSYTYGISVSDKVTCAIQQFQRIRDIFPAPIQQFYIHTNIFSPWRIASRLALQITKVKQVQQMFILGAGTASAACDTLLNNIEVLEKLESPEFRGMGKLKFERMAKIPYVRICIPQSTTAEKIFATAGGVTRLQMPQVSFILCNNLMHLWLNSKNCEMDRLILTSEKDMTKETIAEQYYKLFEGLHHVKGVKDMDYSVDCTPTPIFPDSEADCETWYNNGISLHRKDGAIATVYFANSTNAVTFTMNAEYPVKPAFTARFPALFDTYAWEYQRSEEIELTEHCKARNYSSACQWHFKNQYTINEEQEREFRRYQTYEIMKTHLRTRDKDSCYMKILEMEMEFKQLYTTESRQECGYLCLEEAGKKEK